MDRWIDYDPQTGVCETTHSDGDDDKLIITREEDVAPLLDRNAEARNTRAGNVGITKGLWLYASIPVTVQYELLKRGVNIHRREDHAKMFEILNAEYPYLKTTDKIHSPGRKLSPKKESSTKPGPLLIVR